MKIYFLAKSPDATAYFRVQMPEIALRAAGHEVVVDYLEPHKAIDNSGVKAAHLAWADVIVVQRPTTKKALQVVRQIKATYPKKPVLGDYDDDYYSVPRWNPGYPHIKANEDHWKSAVSEFDGLILSTDALEDAFTLQGRYRGQTAVIQNGFDFETFDAMPASPEFPLQAVQIDDEDPRKLLGAYSITNEQFNIVMADKPVIAWAGSAFHYMDLEWLAVDIKEICERVPDAVFLFVGYVQGNIVKDIPLSRIFTCGGASPVPRFHRLLVDLKIDYMLAPLHPVDFNESKSNLKLMEAMTLGAYPICADMEPYADDIGETDCGEDVPEDQGYGLLVPHEKGAWADAIEFAVGLKSDPAMHEATLRHNRDYVRRKHDIRNRVPDYEAFFKAMLEAKK